MVADILILWACDARAQEGNEGSQGSERTLHTPQWRGPSGPIHRAEVLKKDFCAMDGSRRMRI